MAKEKLKKYKVAIIAEFSTLEGVTLETLSKTLNVKSSLPALTLRDYKQLHFEIEELDYKEVDV